MVQQADQEENDLVVITDVLDLTTSHLSDKDLTEVPMPDSLTSVDLTTNRLTSIDSRIESLPNLRHLSFRQNLLRSAEAIGRLRASSVLETLILHDNKLKEMPPVSKLAALRQLEVSYNELRSIDSLSQLPLTSLQEFFAASNKIRAIEGLDRLTNLKVLELGGNRVSDLSGLETLQQLEELWLGRNRISEIPHFGSFPMLRKLSLQSNRLEAIGPGLKGCMHLKELYLSHNGIKSMQGLEHLCELEVLDVSNNSIEDLEGCDQMLCLKDLWLNDNKLSDLDRILSCLKQYCSSLSSFYICNNPAVAGVSNLKSVLHAVLPGLEQSDCGTF